MKKLTQFILEIEYPSSYIYNEVKKQVIRLDNKGLEKNKIIKYLINNFAMTKSDAEWYIERILGKKQ